MFILMLASTLFPIFYILYKYDIYNHIKNLYSIPKITGFEEIEQKYEDADDYFVINDIKYVNTNNYTFVTVVEEDLLSLRTLTNSNRLLVVHYTINDNDYMIYYDNIDIEKPVYNKHELKKLIFIRTIKNAYIMFDDTKIDITDFIHMFFGPNYNFYNDKNIELNVHRVMLLGYILDYIQFTSEELVLLKNEKYMVEIEDNLDNIIYFVHNDNFEWNPYINYLNECSTIN